MSRITYADFHIHDNDPDRDRKMHDRLSGREPGKSSMQGPYGFAQWGQSPEWWQERQIKMARAIGKDAPEAKSLHPHVWHVLARLEADRKARRNAADKTRRDRARDAKTTNHS